MIPKLLIKWHAASIPKSGNRPDENEDAYAPVLSNGEVRSSDFFQCALSDGATRSSFAGLFARSMVETCSNSIKADSFDLILKDSRSKWNKSIQALDLPWHAQEKVKEGAFATLLWLQFYPKGTNHILWSNYWRAVAIGDSCLFQFRKDKPIRFLPVKHSTEFNNHPHLISSHAKSKLYAEEWESTGSWEEGDDFFLVSDALAKWTYRLLEANKSPSPIFKDRLTRRAKDNHFQEWIEIMRKSHDIKDDDTTLIWIKVM
jgi:hypothetical protein